MKHVLKEYTIIEVEIPDWIEIYESYIMVLAKDKNGDEHHVMVRKSGLDQNVMNSTIHLLRSAILEAEGHDASPDNLITKLAEIQAGTKDPVFTDADYALAIRAAELGDPYYKKAMAELVGYAKF